MTKGRGTQSQNVISASSAFVACIVALRPNNGFQATASLREAAPEPGR